jgi:hypothetical protein
MRDPLKPCPRGHVDRNAAGRCRTCKSEYDTARYSEPEHKEKQIERSAARYIACRAENKAIRRNRHLKKKYNITSGEFDIILAAQGGRCKFCLTTKPGGRGTWHVDHDHLTGRVRWLLCANCNRGLGYFRDSITVMKSAIEHLHEYQSKEGL